MLVGLSVHQVYLATGFTDMRKSINGLSLIVLQAHNRLMRLHVLIRQSCQ